MPSQFDTPALASGSTQIESTSLARKRVSLLREVAVCPIQPTHVLVYFEQRQLGRTLQSVRQRAWLPAREPSLPVLTAQGFKPFCLSLQHHGLNLKLPIRLLLPLAGRKLLVDWYKYGKDEA